MRIFADTSALYAVMSATDREHERAAGSYRKLLVGATLVTSSYVALESLALVQARLGLEDARRLQRAFQAAFRVIWVDRELHDRGWERLDREGRRELSLVDCVSFELMSSLKLRRAFAFDSHFEQAGFERLP